MTTRTHTPPRVATVPALLSLLAAAALAAGCAARAGAGAPAPGESTSHSTRTHVEKSMAAPSTTAPARTSRPARFDFGRHTRPVTTYKPEAQAAFDRGLILAYAFNQGAAESQFRTAAEADPTCAMAFWGIAFVNGPHYNNMTMSPEQVKAAWDAITKASARTASATPTERALIEALKSRYSVDPAAHRRPLDEAYATAMRGVWKAHPQDADVATLFADALMDLRPWDLWTADGKPQPGTEEILATLERAMQLDPGNPGANHLYIHVVEASPHPEKGLAAAERLGGLVPSAGHLVHMPGHVYIRTGRWADAAQANIHAMAADDQFRATGANPGFYTVYMAHNPQFLSFVYMMMGRRVDSLKAARTMVAAIPPEFVKEAAFLVDGALSLPLDVLIRFGEWEEILNEPEPPEFLPISRAMHHYGRAVALTALDRPGEAEAEAAAFKAEKNALPAEAIVFNNTAADVLAIAAASLDGEMLAKRGRLDEAIAALQDAAQREDALKYDEPPDWMQPVRHTLGAVLLRAGRAEAAEAVYRQDLTRYPENGWALFGLTRSLRKQGKEAEAEAAEKQFRKAWSTADTQIGATCLCQPPA